MALALTPGVGPGRFHRLVATFGSPRGALEAPFAFLRTVKGISPACATAVAQRLPRDGARELDRAADLGGTCLLPGDQQFPAALTTIPTPPLLLFALGRVEALAKDSVAIVGSRDHSLYGERVARAVAQTASRAGLAVVSGMARGLDAVAHLGALDAGGLTIGVLGNGLGVTYPAANEALYRRVAETGVLVTEFPPGERPHAGSFPRRNRLIAGLAKVTVVVEAASGSGALITVDAALAQGKEVMAVPGPITRATSVGTNRLIRDGAGPLLEPDDLLQHYADVSPRGQGAAGQEDPDLPTEERRLLQALGSAPVHLDVVAEVTAQPVGEVLDRLCALELSGWVEQLPGRLFVKRNAGGGREARGW